MCYPMSTKITASFIFLLTCLSTISLYAQRDSVMISGIVYDYETREQLSQATFKHNGEFVDISQDGKFQRYVKPGDTLAVRYSGYKDYIIIIPHDLDQVAYISGIFLNKNDIEASESLIVPREYKVNSIASFDPMEVHSLMQNAQHNLNVAAYQAKQAYEWDAEANQKYAMATKEMEIEYKHAVPPHHQLGVSTSTSLQNPASDFKIDKMGEKALKQFTPLSPQEEYYLKTLFAAILQEK